jgi:CHAT domain-containing protein
VSQSIFSRRNFLRTGLCAIASRAAYASRPNYVLSFRGTGGRQTLTVHSGGITTPQMTMPLDVSLKAMRDFGDEIAQPPDRYDVVQITAKATELYTKIWGPISKEPLTYRNVYIHAEDDFRDFPFEALRGGRQWIGRAAIVHYLTQAPGKSKNIALPGIPTSPSYAYAPFQESRELRWTRREARLVAHSVGAELREGNKANIPQLFVDISRPFSILHIATHGLATPSATEAACIAFHKVGADTDTQKWYDELTASELGPRRFNGRLVVLSACAASAAGAQDLSRSFITHGVREVISSRSSIDDAAAFTFMNAFYRELHQGVDSGTALLRARSVMIDGSYPAYGHPYFWAAFRSFI